MWYIHTMEYYSVTERNEIMPPVVTGWTQSHTVIESYSQHDIQIVIQPEKGKYVNSVMPDCLQPHELPTRLLCPWNFPGKNIGVGCHFQHQGIFLNQGSNLPLPRLLHQQADFLPLSHLRNLKYCIISLIVDFKKWYRLTDELICKAEIESQMQKTILWLPVEEIGVG